MKKIADLWVQGLSIGIKIFVLGLIIKYIIVFTLGFMTAMCGSVPVFLSHSLGVALAVFLVPFFIFWLTRILRIEIK